MEIIRAIFVAIVIWILGVLVFLGSYYVPISTDLDQQSNIALTLSLLPLGWFGAKFYYQNGTQLNGLTLASLLVAVAILLDAIITVPLLIIPIGGSYSEFFGSMSFWLIALAYFSTVLLYWLVIVKSAVLKSHS